MGQNQNQPQSTPKQLMRQRKFADSNGVADPEDLEELEKLAWRKYRDEVAAKLGLSDKIQHLGWDQLTAAECGQIGGKLSTVLGDNLMRKIIAAAKDHDEPRPIAEQVSGKSKKSKSGSTL